MPRIFDGESFAARIRNNVSAEIEMLAKKYKVVPKLDVILVGNDPASVSYVGKKETACKEVGIMSVVHHLPETVEEREITALLDELNNDASIHGILVQFPLPESTDKIKIMSAISEEKDVDGFNPKNMGNLMLGNEDLSPCTPKGIVRILEENNIVMNGKNVVVVNSSNIVGKPLALMLANRGATVSICHSKTQNLASHTKYADILITATGVPGLIKEDMIKKGAVVIDIGIKKVAGKIYGDVDFANIKDKASFITPVPGGVGPVTVSMLLENTLLCYKNQMSSSI